MNKFILKNKLLATTAICAISVCANTVKAEEIDILSILNNSTTKSPNITWEKVTSAGENTIQIGDGYYKYTYTTPTDYTEVENLTENISLINPVEQHTYKYVGLGVNNPEGTDYGDIEKYVFSNNKVTASFEDNWGSYLYINGGVISNQGTIGDITADFINNSIEVSVTGDNYPSSYVYGGAIDNNGTIGDITGDFIGNRATSTYGSVVGIAIFNSYTSTIGNITGDFIRNSGKVDGQHSSFFSILDNEGSIESIAGNFINNYINNSFGFSAGAIHNTGTISSIIGDFIGNNVSSVGGDTESGAIFNMGTGGKIELLSGDFVGNYVSFSGSQWYPHGGAIANGGTITFVADGSTDENNILEQDVLFKDNCLKGGDTCFSDVAITNSGTLNFESRNGGSFTFFDSIEANGIINLTGDRNEGVFNMYGNIDTRFGSGSTINIKNPYTFNMVNQNSTTILAENFNIEADSKLNIDVMLSNGTSDYFNVNNITGTDKFTLNKINLVDDMDTNAEYVRLAYANQKLTNNEFVEQNHTTSQGTYAISNDGQNLMIKKTDGIGGFASFLADINQYGAERTYHFSNDEDIGNIWMYGKNTTGEVAHDNAKLTINGNNHTLNFSNKPVSKAMNLKEGQTAEINNLTIKGFETGLINGGEMTLNNITLTANKVGIQNSGNITFQGENTISGSDYAMLFSNIATSLSPAYKYPLTGAIADFEIMDMAADEGISYSQYLENMSGLLSQVLNDEVNVTNGAEYIEVMFDFMVQSGQSIPCTNDIECANTLSEGNVDITKEQYNEIMEVVKTHGKENAGAGYVALLLTAQHPEIPLSDMMAALYSQDTTEQEALIDKMISDAITSGDITEAERDTKTQELTAFITSGQQGLPQADAIYKENGIPSSYEYITATVEKTPTASEYPLTGAFLDFMLAQEAASNNTTYEKMLADLSSSVGANITNGAEFVEFATQQGGMGSCTDDLSCVNEIAGSYLSISLTQSQYNDIIDVVKEYGEEHPGSGFMALMLISEFPDIPLSDMMAILYAEDTATQEALIDGFIEDMVTSGMISEDEKAYAKQEISTIVSGAQQESVAIDTMYADLSIPLPYDYLGIAPSGDANNLGTTLNFAEGAILNLNSKVSGADVYGLTLEGSDDAIINLNSEIEKADLVLDGPTLKLLDESTNLASVNSFEVKNGTLDMQNEVVRTLVAPNFKISGALKLFVDADLANKQMDTLGEVEVTDEGSISVDGIKIISDSAETETSVEFAGESYKDKVSTTVDNVLSAKYEYAVEYDKTTGEFKFVRGNKIASEEVAPNQAPVVTTTTTVASVETVVAQIFDRDVTISTDINYGADTPYSSERVSEEATSDGVNIHNEKSLWVKTFGSDDDLEIDNFNGTIDSEAYGVVGGVDSKVFTYDNGVKAAYGIYGAYVGGKQKYDDNKVEQKSGYLGVSAAFRKNNMFSNFTLNGGYITSEANTEWGKDEFDTKVVSVANKTGFDIKAGNNWTITPAMYVAYTGMDTEDYTNKAGVKMENEFANVVTLAPELKVSNRIGKDLDGYAKVSYKHYIYDTDVKADDVLLEEMSAKPYVEYGFGVEKNWADKSGYAELTRRDGGREGWNVNLGLRLNF